MPEGSVSIFRKGIERLRNGHLWIYRSDIRQATAQAGDIVRVIDERGRFHGRAFYSDQSQIALRILTRADVPVDRAFFMARIRAAAAYREIVAKDTLCYRLIYGEADLLPSIIVDRYADYLSLQTLSQGAERHKDLLVEILSELFSPAGIIERNDPKVRLLEGLEQRVSVLHGRVPPDVQAQQNGILFSYDLHKGQKTGSFLDQRENHRAAQEYASGEVLDCFCYSGGFALTVARHASHVEAVDLSPLAVEAARRNQALNQLPQVTFREANAFDVLKQYNDAGRRFDMVILDPPAFAKSHSSIPAARRGYKEINLRALKILRTGGYLVTCSCSHHISEAMFLQIIADAANDAHRTLAVVERRTQARDHPILLTMPETHYLKAMFLTILD